MCVLSGRYKYDSLYGIIFRNSILEKNLHGFPGAAAEGGKKLPVVKKIPADNFRDAEYEMPVRNLLERSSFKLVGVYTII